MRVKWDSMGKDQLLPGYNVQLGICDEYIAMYDVKQYASDRDCFPQFGRFPPRLIFATLFSPLLRNRSQATQFWVACIA